MYDTYFSGYNSTFGGESNPMDFAKFREKISKSNAGRKRPDQSKRIIEANKNRIYTEEKRRLISIKKSGNNNPMHNKHHTVESRNKISSKLGSKTFYVYKGDELIGEWVNKMECSRTLNIDNSAITKYLSGKFKNSKGYVFKYK